MARPTNVLAGSSFHPHAAGMTITLFAALVGLIGLLVFLIASNPVVKTIGLACFTAGLAACLVVMGNPVRLR